MVYRFGLCESGQMEKHERKWQMNVAQPTRKQDENSMTLSTVVHATPLFNLVQCRLVFLKDQS